MERTWSGDRDGSGIGSPERLDRFEAAVVFAIREASRLQKAMMDGTTDVAVKGGLA